MMERMNNADFHKFLTEFSDAVAQGKYKKMPYDKYRELRKIKNSAVDIYVDTYTDYYGEKISRIIVAPDGPVVYEFDMHDGSFGNFCYDYLKEKEEPKVHPDEKKQYDIYGNVIEDYYNYHIKSDKIDNTAKEVYYDYCVAKATGDNSLTAINTSCVSNAADATKAGISWYDSISTSDSTHATTATIATPSYVQTKTMVDVLQEDVEDLKKLVEGNNCEIATKANLSDVNRDIDALGDAIGETNMRIDECEYDLRERIEEARTAAIEESWYTRAELEQLLDKRIKELEEKYMFAIPVEKMITQSTSSNCYPVKNFKLNVGDIPCSDNRKEKENMDTNKMFNFDFGPVDSHIRMSPYGLAIRNAEGKYVSFDKETSSMMDVEIFNFEAQSFLFKMPVPVNQIAPGDIVVHMRKPMFVCSVNANTVFAVDIYNAEAKNIMPVKSPFGFNFVTKVVSLVDMTSANADNPFGNILPFLMMGEGKSFKDIMPFVMATNPAMMQNPMMMYALMGDGGFDKDMLLPMMFAMNPNFMNPMAPVAPVMAAPATEHVCHCHADQAPCGDNTDAVTE
jgi:hypothetical protein